MKCGCPLIYPLNCPPASFWRQSDLLYPVLCKYSSTTLEQIIDTIHQFGGLAVASHVDRQRFSLIGQLGFIPKGLKLDAVEVSNPSSVRQEYGYPVVTSSDAHFLEDIGKNSTCFMIEDASLQEISKALRCELGRMVVSN